MNNFTLIFTTALLSMMFLQSSEASAQFVRLDVEEIDNGGIVPGKTFRVYAVFTNSGDILDAVYGEASAALKISSTKSL